METDTYVCIVHPTILENIHLVSRLESSPDYVAMQKRNVLYPTWQLGGFMGERGIISLYPSVSLPLCIGFPHTCASSNWHKTEDKKGRGL